MVGQYLADRGGYQCAGHPMCLDLAENTGGAGAIGPCHAPAGQHRRGAQREVGDDENREGDQIDFVLVTWCNEPVQRGVLRCEEAVAAHDRLGTSG